MSPGGDHGRRHGSYHGIWNDRMLLRLLHQCQVLQALAHLKICDGNGVGIPSWKTMSSRDDGHLQAISMAGMRCTRAIITLALAMRLVVIVIVACGACASSMATGFGVSSTSWWEISPDFFDGFVTIIATTPDQSILSGSTTTLWATRFVDLFFVDTAIRITAMGFATTRWIVVVVGHDGMMVNQ